MTPKVHHKRFKALKSLAIADGYGQGQRRSLKSIGTLWGTYNHIGSWPICIKHTQSFIQLLYNVIKHIKTNRSKIIYSLQAKNKEPEWRESILQVGNQPCCHCHGGSHLGKVMWPRRGRGGVTWHSDKRTLLLETREKRCASKQKTLLHK